MFSRILVPLNGSVLATQALRAAERLADRWDCDLHVLTLLEGTQVQFGIQDVIKRQVAAVEHRPRVEIRPVSYSVAEDIAGEFDRVEDTLIVMGTWGRGRSAGVVPNIGEDVLRLIRHPMIVLGGEVDIAPDWPNGPMLIATDGSHFGETIVPTAATMAKAMEVEPRLITVIDPDDVPAEIAPAAEANSLKGLASSVEEIVGGQVQYEVLHGSDPGQAIAECADRSAASLIAMSTHGRSGMPRISAGSVAMNVVRHAHCPVILSRPALAED